MNIPRGSNIQCFFKFFFFTIESSLLFTENLTRPVYSGIRFGKYWLLGSNGRSPPTHTDGGNEEILTQPRTQRTSPAALCSLRDFEIGLEGPPDVPRI